MDFTKNVVYMFPGVGSEYYGMGKELYHRYSIVRNVFKEAKEVVGIDFYDICCGDSKTKLDYINSQQSLVCLGYAIYQVILEELEKRPDFMMGYSLGEYTALVCSGYLKFEDALKIVQERSIIIQNVASQYEDGTMAWVVNINRELLEKLVNEEIDKGEKVYISAYEADEKLSVSGQKKSIEKLAKAVESNNGMMIPINMVGPFHSPLMKEATTELKKVLEQCQFRKADCQVISNYTAQFYTSDRECIIENLSQQLSNPILWQQSLSKILSQGMQNVGLELGPKMVLNYIFNLNSKSKFIYSVEKHEDLMKIKQDISDGEKMYSLLLKKCLGIVTSIPNRCLDSVLYKKRVEDEYDILYKCFKRSQVSDISVAEVKDMLNKTICIMETKGEDSQEIFNIMRQLVSDINLM